jgi:predicted unusual protein kinase regulating ubiquinone biosynthesis (AarF/ABC1/UbiB family)
MSDNDINRDENVQKIETNRLKRAWKLGSLGAKMTGSYFKAKVQNSFSKEQNEAQILQQTAKQHAQDMVKVMGQLKGAAMKFGQFLSTDPDLIDPEFADSLASLQRTAPAVPFSQIHEAIESRLDAKLNDVFSYFDPRPLGSASIGQVHHAILHDGREVAVKVQYPGVKDSLESDLKNIETFLTIGRAFMPKERIASFMQELKDTFIQEADYLAEAQHLKEFNEYFSSWSLVRIPQAIDELCTPEILVMEYIKGQPLIEGLQSLSDQEQRDQLAQTFIQVFIYMFHDFNYLHGDPHPGNFLLDTEGHLVLLDWGCVKRFDARYADQLLEYLVHFWSNNAMLQKEKLIDLGFGAGKTLPSAEAIAEHSRLILAPMAKHELFNFSQWKIHDELRTFLGKNFNFIHLVPPAELLIYLRVLAGIKGTLTQVNANVNIRILAEECCSRRNISF